MFLQSLQQIPLLESRKNIPLPTLTKDRAVEVVAAPPPCARRSPRA